MQFVFFSAVTASIASGSSGLNITADVDSAVVVVDGVVAGNVPLRLDGLAAGLYQIRILHPDLESWVSPVILDSVRLVDGEIRNLDYRFMRNTFIMTDPSGAEVIVGNRVVGVTPVVIESRDEDSLMQVRMHGFTAASVNPRLAERGVVMIRMERAAGDPGEMPHTVPELEERSTLPLILSGASSILAGGFSVYFKDQADQLYREYLLTGDPAKLAETRKLDSVAGIALGASEIYFALFSYLLLSY